MTAREFIDAVQEALEEFENNDGLFAEARYSTYEEAGMLTRNDGLVIRLANGDEFQVTVVQSRFGEDE